MFNYMLAFGFTPADRGTALPTSRLRFAPGTATSAPQK